MHELLELLDERAAPITAERAAQARQAENRLAQVRLGIATALYEALRAKDASTARHSLRVAICCSAWSELLGHDLPFRDSLELAALLHDVGKIGVPDHILLKPAPLVADEIAVMQRHEQQSLAILSACCADPKVLEIVRLKAAWFTPSDPDATPIGRAIPLGARMLAIADAFDSMVSDSVYRPALSRERALGELYRTAGTQFDPELVDSFCAFERGDRQRFEEAVARRWLVELAEHSAPRPWRRQGPPSEASEPQLDAYRQAMLGSIREAVIFVDRGQRILYWNRVAEKLTGLSSESIEGRLWSPALLAMRSSSGALLEGRDCPLEEALETGKGWLARTTIRGRDGALPVEVQVTPVAGAGGTTQGVVVAMRDLSSQVSLEERCMNLHRIATQDPLTKVANRAEFNRVHAQFVDLHKEQHRPCSLIICDLDYFKDVNDEFGHPAGDETLISFATLLRSSCRTGDLVARYGGEEFVLLCADCNNAAAARRAEEIRRKWAATVHRHLDSTTCTASFGVTEIQPGDTPETMLRRADRALLEAKAQGRNRVVQLGTGLSDESTAVSGVVTSPVPGSLPRGGPLSIFRRRRSTDRPLVRQQLVTAVPLTVAIEKLRGFIADHHIGLEQVEPGHLVMRIGQEHRIPFLRRTNDRRVPLLIDLRLKETATEHPSGGRSRRTYITAAVFPLRGRHRRLSDVADMAGQMLLSLRAYLMASVVEDEDEHETANAARPPVAADGGQPATAGNANPAGDSAAERSAAAAAGAESPPETNQASADARPTTTSDHGVDGADPANSAPPATTPLPWNVSGGFPGADLSDNGLSTTDPQLPPRRE